MATELTFQPVGTQVKTKDGLERVADVDPRLTRSYYFDSRLLTAEDLNRDQIYLDGRLREVGQALGYGISDGLAASLDDDGVISVTPGRGVTRAGRVLELTRTLTIDVGDRAALYELNNGRNRRLDRALYVIIVSYAEVGTDIAEAFPTDLSANRSYQYDVISEGVQLSLVRLPQALGQQNDISLRTNLLREWLGDNTAGGAVPEDGVALGVLAVSNDRPQWLDAELLRQPLRAYNKAGDLQSDLARRYENVFKDLMHSRALGSLNGDFAAADYFRLLPPVGSLPKDTISPDIGRQGFFPENFNVWTAPVRLSDIDLLRAESMALPPIDLKAGEPIDIIVLVPLSNTLYGQYAQQLERDNGSITKIPSQDLLRLRLYPTVPTLDTDAKVWRDIWNISTSNNLFYIRRPLRAAETRLSGIVLAKGVPIPVSAPASLPTPADSGLLQNEDGVLLNRINLTQFTKLRPAQGDNGGTAVAALLSGFAGNALVTQQIISALVRIERVYDSVTWQTLLSLAQSGHLAEVIMQLQLPENLSIKTGTVIANLGASYGLDASLVTEWNNIAQA